MSRTRVAEPWRSFLLEIDGRLTEEMVFHCLGGFVMTQLYGSARTTSDVDFLTLVQRNDELMTRAAEGSPLHTKHHVYLDPVGVVNVPENYEDRLTEMFPDVFNHLRLFALDPYDIALSKIERNIERDREDVRHLADAVPFDLDILTQRYTHELRPYLGNPEREDLTLKLWIEMIEETR
jgi:uncharacterized nucleotidyltransferase DUF6036